MASEHYRPNAALLKGISSTKSWQDSIISSAQEFQWHRENAGTNFFLTWLPYISGQTEMKIFFLIGLDFRFLFNQCRLSPFRSTSNSPYVFENYSVSRDVTRCGGFQSGWNLSPHREIPAATRGGDTLVSAHCQKQLCTTTTSIKAAPTQLAGELDRATYLDVAPPMVP